jgi:hypothetical protein
MVLPVMALGLIVFQIADAAMTSVFDEDEYITLGAVGNRYNPN